MVYQILAYAISIVVWFIVLRYKLSGWKFAQKQSKNLITEWNGRGSWYARNITNPISEGLFSALHFGLVIVIPCIMILVVSPSYFPEFLESTLISLPTFLCIGFICGSVFGINFDKPPHDEREDEISQTEQ